jgi:hypothetical protein
MLDENCHKHEGPMGDLVPSKKAHLNESSADPLKGRTNKGGKRRE